MKFKIGDDVIMAIQGMNDSFEKGTKVRIIDFKKNSALVFNGDQTLWVADDWIEPLAPAKQPATAKTEILVGAIAWFIHSVFFFVILLLPEMSWSFRIGLSLIIGHFSAQLSNLVNSKK